METSDIVIHKGEKDKKYQIYVEDYVMSYLKKYGTAQKSKRIFFFGKKILEEKKYYIYGAGAEKEISYFAAQEYLGEISCRFELDKPVFFVQERNRNYEVLGYFIFYQTNEAMQSYMVEQRKLLQQAGIPKKIESKEETDRQSQRVFSTEQKIQDIKKQHKKEQKQQKQLITDKTKEDIAPNHKNRFIVVQLTAVFVVLTAIIINTTNSYDKLKELNQAAVEVFFAMENEDAAGDTAENAAIGTATEMAEEIIDNEQKDFSNQAQADEQENIVTREGTTLYLTELDKQLEEENKEAVENRETKENKEVVENIKENVQENDLTERDKSAEAFAREVAKYYYIEKGDTLYTISQKEYGTIDKVKEICELNQIKDPDNIKYGQKILLP